MTAYLPATVKYDHRIQKCQMEGDRAGIQVALKEKQDYLKSIKVRPYAGLLNFLSAPLYIGWFLGLRDLIQNSELLRQTGTETTFYWISNVTERDPYMILPLVTVCITYLNLKKASIAMAKLPTTTEESKQVMTIMQYLPFFTFPFIAYLPASMQSYFVALNLANFIMSFGLESKLFMNFAKGKDFPKEIENMTYENPYKNYWSQSKEIKEKISKVNDEAEREKLRLKLIKETPIPDLEAILKAKKQEQQQLEQGLGVGSQTSSNPYKDNK